MNRRAFISTVALSLLDFMADRLEAGRRHATAAAASMRFLTGTVPHVAFDCRAGML